MTPLPRAAGILSAVAATCAAFASTVTLVWDGAFPQPPGSAFNGALAEARGWSLITLLMVVPLCFAGLVAIRRGSLRGRLVWLGTLAYLVYAYLEFAVSPPFTALYLLYVGAFAAAIPALLLGAASVDMATLPAALDSRAPRRAVAMFSLTVGVLLAVVWLKGIIARTLAGDFGWPQGVEAIGHVVRALDLGLQVPLGIATGVLLLRRRPSGYLLGAITLVNGVCMGAALTAMVAWSAVVSGQPAIVAIPFAVLPLAALALGIPFFRSDGHEHHPLES